MQWKTLIENILSTYRLCEVTLELGNLIGTVPMHPVQVIFNFSTEPKHTANTMRLCPNQLAQCLCCSPSSHSGVSVGLPSLFLPDFTWSREEMKMDEVWIN